MSQINFVSDNYHTKLFGDIRELVDEYQQSMIDRELAQFDLDKAVDNNPQIELPLPAMVKDATDALIKASHFIAKTADDNLKLFCQLDLTTVPSFPKVPELGWHIYKVATNTWVNCDAPSNMVMVLDCETVLLGGKWKPVCCICYTMDGEWLYWLADVNSVLAIPETIPFGTNNLIVAHNANYDRSYLSSQYQLDHDGNLFFCTMSAVQVCRGISNQQRPAFLGASYRPDWINEATSLSLASVYQFYTGRELDKGTRDLLLNYGITYVRDNIADVLYYCAFDVLATWELLTHVYPEYRISKPALTSLGGMLLMSTEFIPLSERWVNFYSNAESMYEKTQQQLLVKMVEAADATYKSGLTKIQKACIDAVEHGLSEFDPLESMDAWEQQLDWSLLKTGANKGLPRWYVDYKAKIKKEGKASLHGRISALLLKMTWLGSPVVFEGDAKTGCWMSDGEPITHPDDPNKRVTDLFIKGFYDAFSEGVLTSGSESLKPTLEALMSCINWVSLRKRVQAVRTVRTTSGLMTIPSDDVINGTVTGRKSGKLWPVISNPKKDRVGTEGKSMIEVPKGYELVSFDIDSEELRLFALCGDSLTGVVGSTPLSVSVLVGSKKLGNDPHSLVAKLMEMSRDKAKNLVYGCVPMDTQALTRDGWKQYHELSVGTEVLTYNSKTNQQEWQPIKELVRYDDAPVWESGNSTFKVRSTPNHRWYTYRRNRKLANQTVGVRTTEQLRQEDCIIVSAPIAQNGTGVKAGFINKYSQDDYWTEYVLAMTTEQLWVWFNANIATDGCIIGNSPIFCQDVVKQPGLYDAMMLAGHLLGYRVTDSKHQGNVRNLRFVKPKVTCQEFTHKVLENQPVWCMVTENQTWVMRQGSTITITGNTVYGLGDSGVVKYVRQNNRHIDEAEAKNRGLKFKVYMKGKRTNYKMWTGGIGSASFNKVGEIANAPIPTTPLLRSKISKALRTSDYTTTRFNWVIQASGRDFLDMMMVYTNWLIKQLGIPARLMLTIHDELHFMVKKGYSKQVVYLCMVAHSLAWTVALKQLGLHTMPTALLYPESVSVDWVVRKSPKMDCVTPSHTKPLEPFGQEFTAMDVEQWLNNPDFCKAVGI